MDLVGFLWCQPELGGCRSWVYMRWGCGSRAHDGGGVYLPRVAFALLSPLRLLRLLFLLFSCMLSIRSLSASPSLFFAVPPFGLFFCEPFGLLVNGLFADRSEVLRADP